MSASEIDIASPDIRDATEVPRIAFRPHRALPWLVLPQGLAMQVLIEAHAVQVPNTRPWFRGVVSQRGNLIPVFDLAEWAGLTPEGAEREQIASVNLGAQASACALVCSESPTLTRRIGRRRCGLGPQRVHDVRSERHRECRRHPRRIGALRFADFR